MTAPAEATEKPELRVVKYPGINRRDISSKLRELADQLDSDEFMDMTTLEPTTCVVCLSTKRNGLHVRVFGDVETDFHTVGVLENAKLLVIGR